MALIDRNLSNKDQVDLDINLEELFGKDIVNNPSARAAFSQDVIDAIRAQAKEGKDHKGKSFAGKANRYSDSYEDSLEFKAFGKKDDDVTMTLRGTMLNDITLLDSRKDEVTIGFDDRLQSNKAHGHITGNVGVKRDFFGLSESKLRQIASQYTGEFKRQDPPEFISDFTRRQLREAAPAIERAVTQAAQRQQNQITTSTLAEDIMAELDRIARDRGDI